MVIKEGRQATRGSIWTQNKEILLLYSPSDTSTPLAWSIQVTDTVYNGPGAFKDILRLGYKTSCVILKVYFGVMFSACSWVKCAFNRARSSWN